MSIFDELLAILPGELRDTVKTAVASDRFESFSDVLLEALYRWQDSELLREAKLQKLRDMLEEAEAGPSYSSDEVFAEIRARIASRQDGLAAAE